MKSIIGKQIYIKTEADGGYQVWVESIDNDGIRGTYIYTNGDYQGSLMPTGLWPWGTILSLETLRSQWDDS